jgi:lactaldehyde reductase
MSHPCGGQFGVPHGVANAINLPHVIRFNAAGDGPAADGYRDVSEALALGAGGSDEEVGHVLAEHVRSLVRSLGLPTRLSEVGVPEEGIPQLVEGAEGDGCTLVNARETTAEDFAELYRRAL